MNTSTYEKMLALNSDHHRRMSEDTTAQDTVQAQNRVLADQQSRLLIINAMLTVDRSRRKELGIPFKLLELGCGYCGDVETLLESFCRPEYAIEEGAAPPLYTGLEIVPHVLEEARRRYPHLGLHCRRWEEAAHLWPGRFDFIYSRHVMEHAADPAEAVAAVETLLAPGGVAGAVTPHYFPDPEPAHTCQLPINEWVAAYERGGLEVVSASLHEFVCREAHIVVKKPEN